MILKGEKLHTRPKRYTSATLPASLPAGSPVMVDSLSMIADAHGVPRIVSGPGRRSPIAAYRLYGAVGKDSTANRTAHLIVRAPAHFDAVRINVLSAESSGNAWKVTAAPSAKYNPIGPVDASDAAVTPTVVTFGSTDRASPRNPGGGAVTVTSTGASGTAAAYNLIQDRIPSDIMQVRSLDRVDDPTKPPLLYIRIFGTNIPILAIAEMADNSTNPIKNVLGEYYSGYANGDYSLTNPASWAQFGAPCVEVEFFLRGKQIINIGITGDSTDQGWVSSTAVPQFGANINGYMRRFVAKMQEDGILASYSVFAQAGQRSFMSYNNVLPAVLSGELTHLVIRPFSINDTNTGTTAAVALDCLQRTTLLINACRAKGVVPILLRPFACNLNGGAQWPLVQNYVDNYKSAGGLVMDFTSVTNAANGYQLKPEWLTVNAGGSVVDQIHPNDACHQAISEYIYKKQAWLFS